MTSHVLQAHMAAAARQKSGCLKIYMGSIYVGGTSVSVTHDLSAAVEMLCASASHLQGVWTLCRLQWRRLRMVAAFNAPQHDHARGPPRQQGLLWGSTSGAAACRHYARHIAPSIGGASDLLSYIRAVGSGWIASDEVPVRDRCIASTAVGSDCMLFKVEGYCAVRHAGPGQGTVTQPNTGAGAGKRQHRCLCHLRSSSRSVCSCVNHCRIR
jgi:hypothetical protein